MIQRIQSLYLLSAGIINLYIFFSPVYSRAAADPAAWIGIGFALSLTLSIITALTSIFLYKNRPRQLLWVKAGTLIQIVSLAIGCAILFTMGGVGAFLIREMISVFFIFLALLTWWQAGRHIRKDEELIESMDRLR